MGKVQGEGDYESAKKFDDDEVAFVKSGRVDQAARDAESLKKEAQLEAREKVHAMIAEAEAAARTRQLEITGLEQALADKTRSLAERLLAADPAAMQGEGQHG